MLRIQALLCAAATIGLASAASAQARATVGPMLLVPTGDSVRVLLPESPAWGAVVYRRALPAGPWTRLTSEPLRRVDDPARAMELLGADEPAVRAAVGATDQVQMLRRLTYDRFVGGVQATLHPSVAAVRGQLLVDTTARRGATYEYRAAYLAPNGKDTASVVTGRVQVVDVPPAPPAAVHVAIHGREAEVTWGYPAFTGAPGDYIVAFNVYRTASGEATARRVATILRVDGAPHVWRDPDVRPGVSYTYAMRAVDAAQREGASSVAAQIAMTDHTPLRQPLDVVGQAGDGIVRLVWRMSPEARVAGYRVERGANLDTRFVRVTRALVPATSPEFVDSTVVPLDRYFYRVVAVDSAGAESPASVAVPVIPYDHTPPAAPTAIDAKPVPGRHVAISWHASPSSDVRGYYVYRGDDATRLVRLTTKPITATQLVDSGFGPHGLQPGHHYTVRVTAVDRGWNESPPTDTTVFVADDEAPPAPTALHAANHQGRWIDVSWAPSPAVDVRAYEVRRADAARAGAPVLLATVPRSAAHTMSAIRDTTGVHGHRYLYRVTAVDSAGNVSPPAVDSIAFGSDVPPPPTRFVGARYVGTVVEVRWERVITRELAGYAVYRAPTPEGSFTRLASVPADSLTWRDPAPVPGAFYTVRALDRSGNESKRAAAVAAVHPRSGP